MQQKFRNLPRRSKQAIAIGFDIGAAWFTLWLAFSFRFNLLFWPSEPQKLIFLVAPIIAIPLFIHFGLYRAVIRYTGFAAMQSIAKAVGAYGSVFALLIYSLQPEGIPRSIGLLQPLLYLIFIAISRASVRFWLNKDTPSSKDTTAERLLIYGAGDAGIQIANALSHAKHYAIVGFMDDDASLHNKTINGWPVYDPAELNDTLAQHKIDGVLLALPSISKARRFEILESFRDKSIHVRSLPSLSDITSGSLSLADIHELDVDDLLGRTPIAPDADLMAKTIAGKVVLVTGAGGSIGSELCRHILSQNPRVLLLLDHSEYGLYTIHQELVARKDPLSPFAQTQLIPLLVNVRDTARLALIFNKWRPETVYHAAAYKHVPMVEHNVSEGVATNVLGTFNTAHAALQAGVSHFVLISTDKAVRPTNVMGASKRMAELVLQAMAAQVAQSTANTTYTMVRFGNVLDSSGSVVPLFRRQIKEGGPITLTHPEITRYFMTIPEAAQLVIQAAAMAKGGDVFVLDMGESVRIMDLAKRMVALSGQSIRSAEHPDGDIEIKITGLRPGEKLFEELLIGDNPSRSEHPKIMRAAEDYLMWDALTPYLDKLVLDLNNNNTQEIKTTLAHLVNGYNSDSSMVDWLTAKNI
jgi:FlaA1/EpsC-like NDP-sugar epimerase